MESSEIEPRQAQSYVINLPVVRGDFLFDGIVSSFPKEKRFFFGTTVL